jgi:hypothetical protein
MQICNDKQRLQVNCRHRRTIAHASTSPSSSNRTLSLTLETRLDFDSLISGIDTVLIPESLGIDSYRYRIDSS